MKSVIAVIALLLAVSPASDVTGTWTGSFHVAGGDHAIPQVILFKQDGNTLTGSAGPDAGEQYPIENGKADGDRVTFELTSGEWRFTYNLKQSGDRTRTCDNPTKARSPTMSRPRVNPGTAAIGSYSQSGIDETDGAGPRLADPQQPGVPAREWGIDSPPETISPLGTSITTPPCDLLARQPAAVSVSPSAVT